MTPWKHAESSVGIFGGEVTDYIELHNWFDDTKQYTGDWTHRALRHHSAGVQWSIEMFGSAIMNSDGQAIPTRALAEKHIEEDCGYIPTAQDWLSVIKDRPSKWMLCVQKKTERKLELSE